MASLISESRTWRWMFLGALWYLCFLLLERHEGEGFERHVLLIKGILSAEVRPSPQLILPLFVINKCLQCLKKTKEQGKKKKADLFWQSSTTGSLASTRRSTSFTISSSQSITAASLHRVQVLPTYRPVSSARAGSCLKMEQVQRALT